MLKLWELFYETSYSEVSNTDIDLFVKIDTKFRRTQKNISELLKEADRLSKKEQKELYSFVNLENIDLIINNKPNSLGIDNLALILFKNISLWSGMNQKMGASDWSNIIENQFAPIFLKLINAVKENFDSYEYVEWLSKFKKDIAFSSVDNLIGLKGFFLNFSLRIKNYLSKSQNWLEFKEFRDKLAKFGSLSLADKKVIEDLEYLKRYYFNNEREALKMRESKLFSEETYIEIYKYLYENKKRAFIPVDIERRISNKENDNYTIETKKSEIELIIEKIENENKERIEELRKEKQKRKPLFEKTLGDKIQEIKALQKQEFEELIKKADIVDFEHTKTGKQLKVLKVKEKIANFKAFNEYLINNGIAYYSKFAQGFIIKNYERVQVASAVGLAIYSQDLLDAFAKGTLF